MKAIAMRVTKEDLDSIKDILAIKSLKDKFYIFSFFNSLERIIYVNLNGYSKLTETYKTFNREILLHALGIVEEKILNGSELQKRVYGVWCDCKDDIEYQLKPINPEVKQLQELADKLGYKIVKNA